MTPRQKVIYCVEQILQHMEEFDAYEYEMTAFELEKFLDSTDYKGSNAAKAFVEAMKKSNYRLTPGE